MYVEDIPDNSPIAIPPGVPRFETVLPHGAEFKSIPFGVDDQPRVPIEFSPIKNHCTPTRPHSEFIDIEEHDDDEIAQYVQTSKTRPVSIDEVLVSADGIIVDGRFIPIGVLGEAAKAGCMLTKMENKCNCHHE